MSSTSLSPCCYIDIGAEYWIKNDDIFWSWWFILPFWATNFDPDVPWHTVSFSMNRLNSGTKNRHNFFIQANFKSLNIGSDSVDHDESGDIKLFVRFPGNLILKISLEFWNCVGCGHLRGCFIFKITQRVDLIALVMMICKIRGTYLISHQPTQFQPP